MMTLHPTKDVMKSENGSDSGIISYSKTGELPKLDVDGCAAQCAL